MLGQLHVWPRQAGIDDGNRSSSRAARDDLCLPTRRHYLDSGRVRRFDRQDSLRYGDEQGAHLPHGQTHVNRWTDDLLKRIQEGQIDPSFVITYTVGLEQGPEMYKTFRDRHDGCIKVILKP